MKAFVTGGAGFIGSHVVDRLISEGNTVTVYDDLSSGKEEFIKHHMNNDSFAFINADLIDQKILGKEISGSRNHFKHGNQTSTESFGDSEIPNSPDLAWRYKFC